MGNSKDNTVQPGGGVDGERDPLTVGKTSYGEDVKGDSNFHDSKAAQDEAEVQQAPVDDSKPDTDSHVEDSLETEAEVNADGDLPEDAQVANDVESDQDNTDASDKPATPDNNETPDKVKPLTADKSSIKNPVTNPDAKSKK